MQIHTLSDLCVRKVCGLVAVEVQVGCFVGFIDALECLPTAAAATVGSTRSHLSGARSEQNSQLRAGARPSQGRRKGPEGHTEG